MSIKQAKAVAEVLFKEEPAMAKRFKEVITELADEGFTQETIGDLYEVFVIGWIEHTRPKMTPAERAERQRLQDEAASI